MAEVIAILGLAVAVAGLALRWRDTARRAWPVDRSPAKGNPNQGVAYALTLGMMPWAKESTRQHAVAYMRGVAFHGGIFLGLAMLVISPIWPLLPALAHSVLAVVLGLGAFLGLAGIVMRAVEKNLSALSTADDYVSVALVSAFLAFEALALWSAPFTPAMYVVAGIMLAYIPLGKIRHCLYFFFSRIFFGRFFGQRGVMPHPVPYHPGGAR